MIYLTGDIHGNFKAVKNLYERYIPFQVFDDNILICLGDFGANFFFNYRDKNFKQKLAKYKFTYFVIRGNHEERPSLCAKKNPEDWTTEEFFGNTVYVEKAYPYIKYALDYPAVYNINGYSTLVIPGAYSVDKFVRLQNDWSWFPQEQLTAEEMEIGRNICDENDNKFDLILSHTCPICFEPTDLFLSFVNQSLVDKSMERYLGEIEFKNKYKIWCWGHYHAFREYPCAPNEMPSFGNPKRVMLMNEAVELENLMISKDPVKVI